LLDHPLLVLPVYFVVLWLSAWVGTTRLTKLKSHAEHHEDFVIVEGATLTLLALVIGFAFSMAVSRYDQRKNFEEDEANAIGTEYLRADFLPPAEADKVRKLLLNYLDQRMSFYTTDDPAVLQRVDARTAQLQAELWSAVRGPAAAQPTQIMALVVQGMNDVLNSQGYTLAAWRNRIPTGAWILMSVLAVLATMLVGIGAKNAKPSSGILLILPLVISIAFFLIADIDAPRRGIIKVAPLNLLTLAESLQVK
jgi:hypothetical protein